MISQEQTKRSIATGTEKNKKFTCPVVEYEGELAVEFPDELLDELNWKQGDTLVWEQVMADRFTLKLVRK